MKTLIFLPLLFTASLASAQFPKPYASIPEVYSFYGENAIAIDTDYSDVHTPEGEEIISTIKFAPVQMAGITGYISSSFDKKGRCTRCAWMRSYIQTYGDEPDFNFWRYSSEVRDSVNHMLRSDGKISQLEALRDTMVPMWGKPKRIEYESTIQYDFPKTNGVAKLATLNDGKLAIGWFVK